MGMTDPGYKSVTSNDPHSDEDSIATIHRALAAGVNFLGAFAFVFVCVCVCVCCVCISVHVRLHCAHTAEARLCPFAPTTPCQPAHMV